ncbi:MAG: DNA repair protein RecO [Blastocatellales bacterium]|nr:DNA repair protein RecO [Blastocatellales bacterium]
MAIPLRFMPLHQTEAFILRTYTLQEADKICVLLTRDAGKLRGVAHGARRLKSRFGSSLEPFTEVSVTYFQKETRELVSISSCEILHSPFSTTMSSELLGLLHYLAELVIEFLPDHEPNDRVYRLISAIMEATAGATAEQFPALARYGEIWMLKLGGYLPGFRRCAECSSEFLRQQSVWLTSDGAPQCAGCSARRGEEINAEVRLLLADLLRQSPKEFIEARREMGALAQIGSIAGRLIARALERDLKSILILDQLRPKVEAVPGS